MFDAKLLLVLGSLALGCGEASNDATSLDSATDEPASTSASTSSSTGATSSTTAPTTATSASTTATSAADTSSSTTDAPTFDLGVQPDVGTSDGCTAVDFLFVIDDSSSMFEHQQNLVANFPSFIDGIESTLADVDSFQVGVIATDPFSGNPGECILLGALITETVGAGDQSSNAVCGPYAAGFAYMTEQDNLDETFACAAQVGTMGSGYERPMEAMVTAVSKELGDPGECNEGFLRDEALLVVVVITDEYDGEGDPEAPGNGREPPASLGDPTSWHAAVIEAKNGIPENAVALAITNYEGGPCEPADLGHNGANIVAWAELFGINGFIGGICEPDYAPLFAQATDVIANACANFEG